MDTRTRVDNFLAHYASENYDPVKAREYYLRLVSKGRQQNTTGMSDTQKQAGIHEKQDRQR
jgi:hypothetical protein